MSGTALWRWKAVLILGMIGALLGFLDDSWERTRLLGAEHASGPRLVAVEFLPESNGDVCEWSPAGANVSLSVASQQGAVSGVSPRTALDEDPRLTASQRKPLRVIRDPYPAYSAIAVDPIRNEVVVTDNNFFQILVYDRLANTPPTASRTDPKRVLGGLASHIEFQAGLYVDPASGDIYAANNDTVDRLIVFSRQAQGNVPPDRELYTGQTFGLAVDEGAQELYLTVQNDSAVLVFNKMAQKADRPLRVLQGDRTGLAAPHGIALDTKNRLMFVTNHGSVRRKHPEGKPTMGVGGAEGQRTWSVSRHVPGSGKFLLPSISIHSLDAQNDAAPLRTIDGPNTQLNWPTGIAFDPKRGELYVANDAGDEVLVFGATASGNVTPVRVLKGPKTLIKNPTGITVDTQNDELWVSNYGNHSATVYKPAAVGDTPPLRVIRSSPLGQEALMIGNPGALAYDSRREEILAPN